MDNGVVTVYMATVPVLMDFTLQGIIDGSVSLFGIRLTDSIGSDIPTWKLIFRSTSGYF